MSQKMFPAKTILSLTPKNVNSSYSDIDEMKSLKLPSYIHDVKANIYIVIYVFLPYYLNVCLSNKNFDDLKYLLK